MHVTFIRMHVSYKQLLGLNNLQKTESSLGILMCLFKIKINKIFFLVNF